MSRIRLGISTCPNDTFAFHGILSGSVDAHGLEFDIKLMDVEELNRGLATDTFDVAKASFATALRAARDWLVLPSGSALGFGVGPVLLSATASIPVHPRVLLPGEGTTAAMLYALLRQDVGEIRHAVFNQIMPALERGDADLGVCIHEGRFTYASRGLHLVEDLGERWSAGDGQQRRRRRHAPLEAELQGKTQDQQPRREVHDEGEGEGGCVEQLVKAWTPPGEEPRASIILAEKDSRSWGGIGWETFHIGEPGFVHSG